MGFDTLLDNTCKSSKYIAMYDKCMLQGQSHPMYVSCRLKFFTHVWSQVNENEKRIVKTQTFEKRDWSGDMVDKNGVNSRFLRKRVLRTDKRRTDEGRTDACVTLALLCSSTKESLKKDTLRYEYSCRRGVELFVADKKGTCRVSLQ